MTKNLQRTEPVILCIDPSLRHCGLAVFDRGVLIKATHVLSPNESDRGAKAWVDMSKEVLRLSPEKVSCLVIERMKHRKYGPPVDDILEVNGVVGAVARIYAECELVSPYPHEWKGSVPKKIHNNRVYNKLTADEKAAITTNKTYWDDTIDAVGLGLWHLGR